MLLHLADLQQFLVFPFAISLLETDKATQATFSKFIEQHTTRRQIFNKQTAALDTLIMLLEQRK
jgi:hypothetical protein